MADSARTVMPIDPAHAALMFPTLTPAQIARVAAHGSVRPVRIGEVLIEAGERPLFFVVKTGQIEIVRVPERRRVVVDELLELGVQKIRFEEAAQRKRSRLSHRIILTW